MLCHITRTTAKLAVGLVVSLSSASGSSAELTKASVVDMPSLVAPDVDDTAHVADPKAPIEVVHQRHANGQVKIRREVTQDSVGNYILHGEWKMWDADGTEIASGQYKNNRRQGPWIHVHAPKEAELFSTMPYKDFDGPFSSTATFQEGQLHGMWTIVDSQNRKVSEWEYANGVRHGVSTWYHVSGKKMREITFRDGLMEGKHEVWDADSKLVADETYQRGSKLAPKIELYASGQKKSEAMYLHAAFVIDTPDDWWNAAPVTYRAVGEDLRHGLCTCWHANGQKKSEGMYTHGVRDGQFAWWYENSQQAATGSYKQGQPHGAWVWWHQNGQKASMGQYANADLTGQWHHWHKDGQLRQKADYSDAGKSSPALAGPQSDAEDRPSQMSKNPATNTLQR